MKEKEILAEYLPQHMVNPVYHWIIRHKVHLKITQSRKTKLGDYRPPDVRHPFHRISINHDLNPYAFFITFVHELAHLLTHKQYGRGVKAHGSQWKSNYRRLMLPFLEESTFPSELQPVIYQHLRNIKASSHADVELTRMLMQFDGGKRETFVEDLHPGDQFLYGDNRKFQMMEKLRKRFKCMELDSQRVFLFQPLTPVKIVNAGKDIVQITGKPIS